MVVVEGHFLSAFNHSPAYVATTPSSSVMSSQSTLESKSSCLISSEARLLLKLTSVIVLPSMSGSAESVHIKWSVWHFSPFLKLANLA
jgi:hypothetical protein